MMLGLRERTIDLLKNEKNFNMYAYKPNSCGTACCIAGNICVAAGLNVRDMAWNDIPVAARRAWAAEYGREEAKRLEFAEHGWGNLRQVTTDEAIAHINGAPSVYHPWGLCKNESEIEDMRAGDYDARDYEF